MSQHNKNPNSNQQGRPIEVKSKKRTFNMKYAYGAVAVVIALIVAALIIGRPSKAHAADLPTKAAPSNVSATAGYPAANGFYLGIGSFAEMSNSTVNTGTGVNTNINSLGAAVEGVIGYQWHIGANWAATEASVNYTNLGGSANCGALKGATLACGVNGPWGFGIEQQFGFDWLSAPTQAISMITSAFGTNPQGLVPTGTQVTSVLPYVAIRADFDNVNANVATIGSTTAWQVAPEFRLGLVNHLKNSGGVLRTYVGYEFGTSGFSLTKGATVSSGDTAKAGVAYDF